MNRTPEQQIATCSPNRVRANRLISHGLASIPLIGAGIDFLGKAARTNLSHTEIQGTIVGTAVALLVTVGANALVDRD